MAGMGSRNCAGGPIFSVHWLPATDVPASTRLRNRRTISSDRPPCWVFRLHNVLDGASTVGSVECRHELALLGRRVGLLLW